MKHFRRLACFIQTQTKPPLFFLPAKHTLRTLELLKDSSKKIESNCICSYPSINWPGLALIEMRREEMDRELKRMDAFINYTGKDNGSDQEYETEKNVKSAIVVKNEQQQEEDEKKPTGEAGGEEQFGQGEEGGGRRGNEAEGSEKSAAEDENGGVDALGWVLFY
jgi:hypothetical protein